MRGLEQFVFGYPFGKTAHGSGHLLAWPGQFTQRICGLACGHPDANDTEALADDPVPTQLYGFTRLGHFELTRARRGATLAAQLEALQKTDD